MKAEFKVKEVKEENKRVGVAEYVLHIKTPLYSNLLVLSKENLSNLVGVLVKELAKDK